MHPPVSPKIVSIRSENDMFQIFDALKRKRETRNREGSFLVEGVRNINNALANHWNIRAFVYTPQHKQSAWATAILKASTAKTHFELAAALLKKVSDKDETSELLAVVEIPKDELERITVKDNPLIVVFDRPSSPGNLGTLIRSCDALGVDGLVITGHAVDVYDPETVRASTGSLFALPVVRLASHKELEPWIRSLKRKYPKLSVVGTDEKGSERIEKHDFSKPTIILVGNETNGLCAAYTEIADAMVKIPIQGSASSLNVACASSIVLYEIARQRSQK